MLDILFVHVFRSGDAMFRKFIFFGLGSKHAEKKHLSRILIAILATLIWSSAEAGFLSGLIGDACSDGKYKVGQILPVTLKLGEIRRLAHGGREINELGEYGFIHYMNGGGYEIKDSNWGKHALIVSGLPIEQIKQYYKQTDGKVDLGIEVKIADLDGHLKEPVGYCGVKANFERVDSVSEKKMAQLESDENARNAEKMAKSSTERIAYEQCVTRLDLISTESGSDKELKDWLARCEETIKASGDSKGSLQKYDAKVKEILKVRTELLLAGKQKIESYDDAKLVHKPLILESIAFSPLLKADGKIYATQFWLTLEAEDGANLLRAVAIDDSGRKPYVFLRTTKDTLSFHPEKLRIGGVIFVLGRYIGNTKYTTIMGETKSAPTLEVMYMDAGAFQ